MRQHDSPTRRGRPNTPTRLQRKLPRDLREYSSSSPIAQDHLSVQFFALCSLTVKLIFQYLETIIIFANFADIFIIKNIQNYSDINPENLSNTVQTVWQGGVSRPASPFPKIHFRNNPYRLHKQPLTAPPGGKGGDSPDRASAREVLRRCYIERKEINRNWRGV